MFNRKNWDKESADIAEAHGLCRYCHKREVSKRIFTSGRKRKLCDECLMATKIRKGMR